jgi:hypothetical protein
VHDNKLVSPVPVCNNWGMSNTAHNTNGKGRVVTSAPKSAKGKSTKSKSVGIPTRKTAKGHADIIASVRQSASVNGHKLPYENTVLDKALAQADKMPNSLTSVGIYSGVGSMPKSASDAQARREWCAKVRAPRVAISDILHQNKDGESISDRSENAVRIRVRTRSLYLYGVANHYYAIRCAPVTGEVSDQPEVYIVRV